MFRNSSRLVAALAAAALVPVATAAAQDPVLDRMLALPSQSGMALRQREPARPPPRCRTRIPARSATTSTRPRSSPRNPPTPIHTQPAAADPGAGAPSSPRSIVEEAAKRTGTTCKGKAADVRHLPQGPAGQALRHAPRPHRRSTRPAGGPRRSLSFFGWLNRSRGRQDPERHRQRPSSGCTGTSWPFARADRRALRLHERRRATTRRSTSCRAPSRTAPRTRCPTAAGTPRAGGSRAATRPAATSRSTTP